MPADILSSFVDWIMASPCRQFGMFCFMAGMFVMFSVLTGYWIISGAVSRLIERVKRRW